MSTGTEITQWSPMTAGRLLTSVAFGHLLDFNLVLFTKYITGILILPLHGRLVNSN